MSGEKWTFIDLFAGCGGLSEGFYQEGFEALAHVEINPVACKTLRTRMKYYGYENADEAVLEYDITKPDVLEKLDNVVKGRDVDLLIGGPPCQAFSTVGRARDPNSMQDDPRNYLFENYINVLNYYMPKIFIFENVTGLLSAHPKGVKIFDVIIKKMRETYKVMDDPDILLLNSVHYGVPQIRKRLIIIGVRKDLKLEPQEVYKRIKKTNYAPDDNNKNGLEKFFTVKDAIFDLPKLLPGEGCEEFDYEYPQKTKYLSLLNNKEFYKVYNHRARNHNEKDQERYKILSENQGWQLKDLNKIRPDLIHHDPNHFCNRYTVQVYNNPATTIVAHLFKDGNLFIHPDSKQHRTITVREAARLQSFPDDFWFEGARTEQFKQVGNAVPPLMAKACAKAIKDAFKKLEKENV